MPRHLAVLSTLFGLTSFCASAQYLPPTSSETPSPSPRGAAASPSVIGTSSNEIILKGVRFEFNRAVLTADSLPRLEQLAQALAPHPRLTLEIQGYTDSVGSEVYNEHLSWQRAQAVRDYLVGHGVGSVNVIALGHSKTNPIASNATEAGRLQNRRVVLSVVSNLEHLDIQSLVY